MEPAPDTPPSSDGDDAAAGVASSDQWVTRCICSNNSQVDGFMIECERCQVWQHGDCVKVDKGKVPHEYFCEQCRPDLHDSRGHWTGGITRPSSNKTGQKTSAKKKRTKGAKKQSHEVVGEADPSVEAQNSGAAPPGSAPDANPVSNAIPGADVPSSAPAVDDHDAVGARALSREERKIVKIMQTIQLMEDRDKKRRRASGGQTPERSSSVSGSTLKRQKKSIKTDFSLQSGYDLDQLKDSPALLQKLFPVSPFYLGTKIWLLHQKSSTSTTQSAPAAPRTAPSTPTESGTPLPLRNRLVQQYLQDPSHYGMRQNDPMVLDSHQSSPSHSAPSSPPHRPQPPPPSEQQTQPERPRLQTIPRLSTIPKLGASRVPSMTDTGTPSSSSSAAPAQQHRQVFSASASSAAVPSVAPTISPLSNLSALMQSYMNAPNADSAPIADTHRFKPPLGGTGLAPSAKLGSSGALPMPLPPFNRRTPGGAGQAAPPPRQ